MSIDRLTRVNQLLKQEVAETLFRVVNDSNADMGAVTVTRVVTSSNLRRARVFLSIRGTEEAQNHLFGIVLSHRKAIQHAVARDVVLKYTPQIFFELDHSIEEGDHILELITELEEEQPNLFEHDEGEENHE